MEKFINRRDFLKIAGLFSMSLAAPQFLFRPSMFERGTGQNRRWSRARASITPYGYRSGPFGSGGGFISCGTGNRRENFRRT